jgi:uncharacterized protein YgbK (DUF1537 family)
VHGVPVAASEFGRDARHPAATSTIAELLLVAGCGSIATRGAGQQLPPRGIVVVDADSDGDLDRVVGQVDDVREVLWVGSPGLAGALARACGPAVTAPPHWPAASRTVLVLGTRHPATRAQLRRLRAELGARACVQSSARPLAPDVEVALVVAPGGSDGDRSAAGARRVATRLATAAADLLRREDVDACVASGGETAGAVLRALGVSDIELLGEPEPGIALGAFRHEGRPRLLATKAGAFGDDDTLVRLHRVLTQEKLHAR